MPLPRHFVERTRAVSLLSSDSEDDASDSEPIGQFNLPPGSTARDLDFDFTGSQAFSRNTANPTTAADWTSYLSSIPYKADAPVGTRRRRLVRKRDVDLDGDDDNQSDHGDENIEDEVVDEDVIEADRRKIEDAADRLGCKRVIVKVTRREQVQADSMGEEVVGGRIQAEIDSRGHISRPSSDMMDTPTNETPGEGGSDKENLPQQKPLSTPTSVKKKPIIPEYNLADLDADDDELPDNIFGHIIPTAKRNGQKRTISATDLEASDEDEDFVLRKPGVPTSSKTSAAKRHAGGNDRALVPRVRAKMNDIDEMETIQGAQIGKIKDVRKFQDVVEEKVRWLVPGMRTPLFEHQVRYVQSKRSV